MHKIFTTADIGWELRDGAEMLRALLPNIWAHRAFASSSRFSFGNTGAILMFHEVQEDPECELRTGCSAGFLDTILRGLIARRVGHRRTRRGAPTHPLRDGEPLRRHYVR